ncbi:MAG: Gfo/Idh/MocA family oxidoreductase [Opitutaceae bacterium]|jgi:predicted dehydrogenase
MSDSNQTHSGDALSRRDFMLSSLAAAGGIMLVGAPSILKAATPGADAINVALVGLGSQGRILLEAMLNIPGLNFRAVCDIWDYSRIYGQRKLGKAGFKVNAYADIEDMLAKEKGLDAVVIATPDFWHSRHTNICLKAGLNVYCEKMMARTVDEARSMVRTMKETGKLLQIGHQRRSNPRYIHALDNLIKKARIPGRLTNANAQWNRAVSPDLGFPKNAVIPTETLLRYGFKDMHQFRNWRWFRDLSGGPISDLGSHQIDIFGWFFQGKPVSVMAGGGLDYYKGREWYDNVMAIFEFDTPEGKARAFYQVLTTTSAGGGYFEQFMGDEGSVKISENPALTKVYREDRAPSWDRWVAMNYLRQTAGAAPAATAAAPAAAAAKVDVRETAPLVAYEIPIVLDKPIHQPHLENFFDAMRGKCKLNCDGEHAFASEAAIFKVNPAVEARCTLEFKPEDFIA